MVRTTCTLFRFFRFEDQPHTRVQAQQFFSIFVPRLGMGERSYKLLMGDLVRLNLSDPQINLKSGMQGTLYILAYLYVYINTQDRARVPLRDLLVSSLSSSRTMYKIR